MVKLVKKEKNNLLNNKAMIMNYHLKKAGNNKSKKKFCNYVIQPL